MKRGGENNENKHFKKDLTVTTQCIIVLRKGQSNDGQRKQK